MISPCPEPQYVNHDEREEEQVPVRVCTAVCSSLRLDDRPTAVRTGFVQCPGNGHFRDDNIYSATAAVAARWVAVFPEIEINDRNSTTLFH